MKSWIDLSSLTSSKCFCVQFCTNTLENGMNSSLPPPKNILATETTEATPNIVKLWSYALQKVYRVNLHIECCHTNA